LRKQAVTFLKKSNQKTFGPAGAGARLPRPAVNESFLLLFFKKEALAFPLLLRRLCLSQ
jgi:hypothetical protein